MKRLALVAALAVSSLALAHSGGTDANGCHTNHKTGEYHCHTPKRSGVSGAESVKAKAAPKLEAKKAASTHTEL